jgi:hypothetical protein
MTTNSTIKRHADLVDRMANAQGVDLEEAAMEGRLAMDTLTDAVLACTGCANPEDCEAWLAAQSGVAAETPGYCRNANLFATLKTGGRA